MNTKEHKVGFWQIVWSTLAAAFGVQSSKNLERDAKNTSVLPYVVAGLIFTTAFVITVVTIVRMVLSSAGV